MVKFVETDENPICPYCERELDIIEVKHDLDQSFYMKLTPVSIYLCPYCKKILPIAVHD